MLQHNINRQNGRCSTYHLTQYQSTDINHHQQNSQHTLPPMRTWFSSCFNFSAFIL